jgi:hypothetical protein
MPQIPIIGIGKPAKKQGTTPSNPTTKKLKITNYKFKLHSTVYVWTHMHSCPAWPNHI